MSIVIVWGYLLLNLRRGIVYGNYLIWIGPSYMYVANLLKYPICENRGIGD